MKQLWQIETKPYVPRISVALDRLGRAEKSTKKLPTAPFSVEPTREQHTAYSLVSFARSGAIVVDQLIDNAGLLWSEGRMVGISSLIRFALEYWAAVHFGRKILETYLTDKNIEEAMSKTARLTTSGKTPVRLLWGGLTENKAYSVMSFIDVLSKTHPNAKDDYDFLSEASHPNFLQNFYFIMASRVYDNFSNEVFKKHAHEVMERTIVALERVAEGISVDSEELIDLALPLLPPS
jgi:hypothetical protein